MSLTGLKSQLATLKALVPPKPGRPPVFVFAAKGPRPVDGPADTATYLNWYYADLGELEELRARFKREYEDTRGPDDPPCIFVRFTSQREIFDEHYRGTKYEHLWGAPPTADEVAP